MTTEVTLPALGESVTEGTVTRWLKSVGDTIAVDEPLVEISTDKVDTEIPSPVAGVLTEIVAGEDVTVEVGAVLARIGSEDAAVPSAPAPASPAAAAASSTPEPAEKAAPSAPSPSDTTSTPPSPAPVADSSSAPATSSDAVEVTLPALGESVTEGTVTRWLKSLGDSVEMDEPLVEISTDKVDTEIPSPVAGTLAEIVAAEDATIEVGGVLARIGSAGAVSAATTSETKPAPAMEATASPAVEDPPAAAPAPATPASATSSQAGAPAPSAVPPATAPAPQSGNVGYVTPLVRNLAQERGVDLSTISGTGVGGRIRKEDVLAATPATAASTTTGTTGAGSVAAVVSELRGQTVPMTKIRKITAERMLESMQSMAQLTTVIEVDCTRLWALRNRAKVSFEKKEGAKLTFLPFFTKAAAEALQEHAFLNASIDGESIVYHDAVNMGIAVDTPKGLMVPVIKNADSISLADHARAIADLAGRARDGKATLDDLQGATFTVTNTGSGGTLFDTPVVASPQVGILATPLIEKRPVVVKGPDGGDVFAIRPMMYLPLSYDHRLVDGADAARFLQSIKTRIETAAFEGDVGL